MGERSIFGGLYGQALTSITILAVLCLGSAIALAIYSDFLDKPGSAVESSIEQLWRAFYVLIGALVGFLTGPRLTGNGNKTETPPA